MAETVNPYGHTPVEGGGQFFKLENGKSARIRIISAPYIYRGSFTNPGGDVTYSNRYGWIIYNHDEGMAQVLKQSATFFKTLQALAKDPEWGDPTGYDITITRNGEGKETTYQIVGARQNKEIPDAKQTQIADMSMADFKEPQILPLVEFMGNGGKFPEPVAGTPAPSGDVPIKDLDNPLDQ